MELLNYNNSNDNTIIVSESNYSISKNNDTNKGYIEDKKRQLLLIEQYEKELNLQAKQNQLKAQQDISRQQKEYEKKEKYDRINEQKKNYENFVHYKENKEKYENLLKTVVNISDNPKIELTNEMSKIEEQLLVSLKNNLNIQKENEKLRNEIQNWNNKMSRSRSFDETLNYNEKQIPQNVSEQEVSDKQDEFFKTANTYLSKYSGQQLTNAFKSLNDDFTTYVSQKKTEYYQEKQIQAQKELVLEQQRNNMLQQQLIEEQRLHNYLEQQNFYYMTRPYYYYRNPRFYW